MKIKIIMITIMIIITIISIIITIISIMITIKRITIITIIMIVFTQQFWLGVEGTKHRYLTHPLFIYSGKNYSQTRKIPLLNTNKHKIINTKK
jgi:hypothetical protein